MVPAPNSNFEATTSGNLENVLVRRRDSRSLITSDDARGMLGSTDQRTVANVGAPLPMRPPTDELLELGFRVTPLAVAELV